MHDLGNWQMQLTQDARDGEIRTSEEEVTDRVEADILRLPRTNKPRTALELQRWLDMCG